MKPDEPQDNPVEPGSVGGHPAPHRVRLPGFSADTEVGLGDVVKRAASLAGIRPCGSCRDRAARLNRWMVLHGRR
jgi:hypothetical protein